MYVQVWDPDRKMSDIFCGDIDFEVPFFKALKQNPENPKSWTKVVIETIPNEYGPFDGMWGYYKVLSKDELN
jgi:hypothetical protein